MNEGFAVQGHGETYESYQKPRYFGTDAIISEGYELVWNDGNDQGVDEKIGKNSYFRYWVSSSCMNAPTQKRTKHYNCSANIQVQSSVPR